MKIHQIFNVVSDDLEELPTLLIFNVVGLNSDCVSLDVKKSIVNEGIMIYEKV